MTLVIAALAVTAGLAVLRAPRLAASLVLALGIVAAAAAASRPDAGGAAPVPSLVGVAAGSSALLVTGRVLRARVRDRSGDALPATAVGRREVLAAVGGTAGVALLAGAGGRVLAARAGHGVGPGAVALPAPADPAPALPAVTVGVPGSPRSSRRPPTSTGSTPRSPCPGSTPRTGGCAIHGHGRPRARRSTFDDLLALPLVERAITLTCVSNEVGGKLARQRRPGSACPLATCSRQAGVRTRTPTWCSPRSVGRLDRRHAARRADGRARRDARRRHERRAAAGRARLPGADGRARASTATCPRPSGWSTSRSPGSTGPRRTGPPRG